MVRLKRAVVGLSVLCAVQSLAIAGLLIPRIVPPVPALPRWNLTSEQEQVRKEILRRARHPDDVTFLSWSPVAKWQGEPVVLATMGYTEPESVFRVKWDQDARPFGKARCEQTYIVGTLRRNYDTTRETRERGVWAYDEPGLAEKHFPGDDEP